VVEMAFRTLAKRILHSRLGPSPQSIAGATIGLVAVVLPWLACERLWWSPDMHYFEVWYGVKEFTLLDVVFNDALGLSVFCTVFLLGTILALFTPVGSVLQIVGLTVFSFGFGGIGLQTGRVETWSLGLGYALGIVSTLVVVDSMVGTMATANNGKPVMMLSRVAALSPRTISSWR